MFFVCFARWQQTGDVLVVARAAGTFLQTRLRARAGAAVSLAQAVKAAPCQY